LRDNTKRGRMAALSKTTWVGFRRHYDVDNWWKGRLNSSGEVLMGVGVIKMTSGRIFHGRIPCCTEEGMWRQVPGETQSKLKVVGATGGLGVFGVGAGS
jgi:hypothetical protein